jgi:L-2-hydroxyglutarate oxidase
METTVAIVGGGILGVATAHRLVERFEGVKVHVLEKEPRLAFHQTGNNSGVLHAGAYYRPGSWKARLCRRGLDRMKAFCTEHGIRHEVCGKIIVAKNPGEEERLLKLFETSQANGVNCEWIGPDQIKEREPHVKAHRAILVHDTGIADYKGVTEKMAGLATAKDAEIHLNAKVTGIRQDGAQWVVTTPGREFRANLVINCAGLQCDRICALTGIEPPARIVPFRGEYYKLTEEAKYLVNHLIYPVPDPTLPFLGVHFTRMVDGSRECGPNAVLAFAREGYTFWNINPRDLAGTLLYPGFRRLAWSFLGTGIGEMKRSLSKSMYLAALQELIPELKADQIVRANAGIRAQAVFRDGRMVKDFLIVSCDGVVNVLNAPSPAATASLAFGDHIVDQVESLL